MLAEAPKGARPLKLTKAEAKASRAPGSIQAPQPIAQGEEEELYLALKVLRKRLADERNIPAYIVFSDATLQHMARFRPTTPDHLLAISGVGPKKLETYGEVFLDLLRKGG